MQKAKNSQDTERRTRWLKLFKARSLVFYWHKDK